MTEPNIKISVAITTHNRPILLDQALNSVFEQTMLPNEIVISEDGNDEETSKLINKYIIKNNQIHIKHLINNPPLKQLKNRQLAISSTNGEYVAMLDDDDKWDNKFLEKTYNALSENEVCDFCSTDHFFINDEGTILQNESVSFSEYCGRKGLEEGIYEDIFTRVITNHASLFSLQHTLFKRNVLEEIDFFQPFGGLVPDLILFLTLGLKEKSAYYIPERLGFCRIHAGQQTSQRIENSSSKVEGLIGIYRKYGNLFSDKQYKIFKKKFGSSVLERSISLLQSNKKRKAIKSLLDLNIFKYYRLSLLRLFVLVFLLLGLKKTH